MNRARRLFSVFCVSLCGLCVPAVPAQAQQLYKCTMANGRVQYQQDPCQDAVRQSTVRPPDPVSPKTEAEVRSADERAAKAAPEKADAAGRPPARSEPLVERLSDIDVCRALLPDFGSKHGAAIEQWERANASAIAKHRDNDGAIARASGRTLAERDRLEPNPAAASLHCEKVASQLRSGT